LAPFVTRGGGVPRVMAKGEVESKTSNIAAPMSQKATLTDTDAPLVEDIQLLNDILAETVSRVNPRVHDLYKKFRLYGLTR